MIPFESYPVSTRRRRHSALPSNFLVFLAILAFTAISIAPAYAQVEALTLPRNLSDLVGESQIVVQGTVSSVNIEPHVVLKNLTTLVVTLQVEEGLKGQPG